MPRVKVCLLCATAVVHKTLAEDGIEVPRLRSPPTKIGFLA